MPAFQNPWPLGYMPFRQSIQLKNAAIGILGFGPIGMSVLLTARAQGAKRIMVTDRIDATASDGR